jgi:hypothetical protein
MKYTASVGSISHATLVTADLLDAFVDELVALDLVTFKQWRDENLDIIQWLEGDRDEEMPHDAEDVVGDLIDILNEYAPPYCYFGANEGDGSDFGYWPCPEALRDGIREGEIILVDDGSIPQDLVKSEVVWSAEYTLHISDHGNETLYRNERKEIW